VCYAQSVLCMLHILQPIYLQNNRSYDVETTPNFLHSWSTYYPMFCQLLPHIRNCRKLPITAPKTVATALACSHKPTAHSQRNCLACLGPSAVQVTVSPCCRFCWRCRIPRRCRSHQCCRIPHCPIVSSQHCFVKPWAILVQAPTLVSILPR